MSKYVIQRQNKIKTPTKFENFFFKFNFASNLKNLAIKLFMFFKKSSKFFKQRSKTCRCSKLNVKIQIHIFAILFFSILCFNDNNSNNSNSNNLHYWGRWKDILHCLSSSQNKYLKKTLKKENEREGQLSLLREHGCQIKNLYF